MIRLKNLHQVVRPVTLPAPDQESLRKFIDSVEMW